MQHLRCRFLAAVFVERFTVRIERTVSTVEAHRHPDRDGVQLCEDESQVLDGTEAPVWPRLHTDRETASGLRKRSRRSDLVSPSAVDFFADPLRSVNGAPDSAGAAPGCPE